MVSRPKPLVLLILDGFGCREEESNNAIAMANTPCWDELKKSGPKTKLDCSGDVEGLPGQHMGNSEVGHLHIGSGRLIRQDLSRANEAIIDGGFFENEVLCQAVDQALAKDKALHVLCLLSPGVAHSHEGQILAMLELVAKRGLKKIYQHAFLDGRDVRPKSAEASIQLVEDKFAELACGRIVSLIGRFYAMDRDNRRERAEDAHKQMAGGECEFRFDSALEGLVAAYARDEADDFVSPTAILEDHVRLVTPEDSGGHFLGAEQV